MLFFEEYDFAFLHINKTGGTSTKEFLTEVLPSASRTIGLRIRPDGRPATHEPLNDKLLVLEKENVDLDKLRVLVTVRNPYDRFVSLYTAAARNFIEKSNHGKRARLAARLPFSKWLKKVVISNHLFDGTQVGPQVDYLRADNAIDLKLPIPDNIHIIRVEDAVTEIPDFVNKELGVHTNVPFPHRNISNHMRDRETMDYYSDHLKKTIYKLDQYIIDNYYPDYRFVQTG